MCVVRFCSQFQVIQIHIRPKQYLPYINVKTFLKKKGTVYWVVTLYSSEKARCLGETRRLHLSGRRVIHAGNEQASGGK
jgi:hypothetical protein